MIKTNKNILHLITIIGDDKDWWMLIICISYTHLICIISAWIRRIKVVNIIFINEMSIWKTNVCMHFE
jgi:hypothetical protein